MELEDLAGAEPTAGRRMPRSTSSSWPSGATSNRRATSSELAVGELMSAITVGAPIIVKADLAAGSR